MARSNRTGQRKTRGQRQKRRSYQSTNYLIVTDTDGTERCYFEGIRDSLPENQKKTVSIQVVKAKTQNMIKKCLEKMGYSPSLYIPWIVFDRDEVPDFDKIISEAEDYGIKVGWSNPCFEIWMYAYFGEMPVIPESKQCCSKFGYLYEKKTGFEYKKSDKDLYRRLCENGNEEKAIKLATQKYQQCRNENKTKPSDMYPATRVHELVAEIRAKSDEN